MTFLRKEFPFLRQKFLMTFVFPHIFQILPVFTVSNDTSVALPSREKPTFREKTLDDTFFYSVRTFARIQQHYFSEYWVDECMGRPPTSKFWGVVPQYLHKSPPMTTMRHFPRH